MRIKCHVEEISSVVRLFFEPQRHVAQVEVRDLLLDPAAQVGRY
jgi:hypothetical protein